MLFKMTTASEYIKSLLPGNLYYAAKPLHVMISGPALISAIEGSFIKKRTVTVFVTIDECEPILSSIRNYIKVYDDIEGGDRNVLKVVFPHFTKSSKFVKYGIVACYKLKYKGGQTVVYVVNGRTSLALKVQGIDVLETPFYNPFNDNIFVTETDKKKILNRKAAYTRDGSYMLKASRNRENGNGERYIYNRDEFLDVESEFGYSLKNKFPLEDINIDHGINKNTKRFAIMTILANSIKYFCKYGYSYSNDGVLIGMKKDPIITGLPMELFIPALETYDYYDMSLDNLYNFYKKAVLYNYKNVITPGYIYTKNSTYYVYERDDYIDYTDLRIEDNVNIGYLDYNTMKYSFDYKYYNSLGTEIEKEKYMKYAFSCHCGYAGLFINNMFGKQSGNSSLGLVEYYEKKICGEINNLLKDCCNYSVSIDEAEYLGPGANPNVLDYVDDENYIDYKRFLKNKNNVIFCVMDDRVNDLNYQKPAYIIATTRQQLYKDYLDLQNIVYECTERFDNVTTSDGSIYTPLGVIENNIKISHPYYNIMGGQNALIGIQDFMLIINSNINVFKLYRYNTLDRIVALSNVGRGINLLQEEINLVSGIHCQPGASKPVYRMYLSEVSEFYEVEKEDQIVASGPTKEELLVKYPEIRTVVENPELTRQQKIIAVNRMQIDGSDKMRMIGYIQSEVVSGEVVILQHPE